MPLTDFTFDPAYRAQPAYDPSLWRQLYQAFGRYLEDLSEKELRDRYVAVLKNKAAFSQPHHLAHTPHNSPWSFWYWVRKEEELEEEFKLRGLPLPDVVWGVPVALRGLTPPILSSSLTAVEFVARFGDDTWLRDAYTHGKFRLKHARGYPDTGLNEAQRDDELTASSHSPGRAVKITTLDGKPIVPKGKVTYQRTFACDTYLLCTSLEFDPAMFHHFGYNACLIVHDLDAFRARLEAAFAAKMPNHGFFYLPVAYLDEYNARPILCKNESPAEVVEYRPLETKRLSFAYQKEYRFFWYSLHGTTNGPDHVEIEAGPQRDIASYYVLDAAGAAINRIP